MGILGTSSMLGNWVCWVIIWGESGISPTKLSLARTLDGKRQIPESSLDGSLSSFGALAVRNAAACSFPKLAVLHSWVAT